MTTEVTVNRDPEQYYTTDDAENLRDLDGLIDDLLLGRG